MTQTHAWDPGVGADSVFFSVCSNSLGEIFALPGHIKVFACHIACYDGQWLEFWEWNWLWSRSGQNNCTAFVVHIRSFHFIVSFWEGRSLHSYRIWNLERIKSVFNPCNEKVILSFSFREGQQPVFQLPLPPSPQPIAHTVKVTSIGSTHIIRSFTTPIAFGGVTKLPG